MFAARTNDSTTEPVRELRDAGHEVVVVVETVPEAVAAAALQEDADVVVVQDLADGVRAALQALALTDVLVRSVDDGIDSIVDLLA